MVIRRTFPILILLLFASVTFLFAVYSTPITSSQSQNLSDIDEHKKLAEAIRRGGYREAARIKGHYVGTVDPNWDWASFNLETLTKSSAAVVVGVPERSKGELSPNGDMVMTTYDVKVEETLKGPLGVDVIFKVALPGGRVDFDDGTSAEIQTPEFERMVEGKKYLLFLYANRNGSDVFLLTGGPQGLFELKTTGAIKPHGRSTDPGVKEVQSMNADGLREKVRIYAHMWPDSGQCCK
jgi:hypothetical protein